MSWWQEGGLKLFRSILAFIDRAVYPLITSLYNLIVDLANVKIFDDATLNDFATRVYTLLGVFMLFKITFSFIMYIINPDAMSDKTKGVGSIIKNVIIVLILIIITPRAFGLLYDAQSAILEDNIIPRFILGIDQSADNSIDHLIKLYDPDDLGVDPCDSGGYFYAASDADYISLIVFSNFFQPNKVSGSNLSSILNSSDTITYCHPSGKVAEGNNGNAIGSSVRVNDFLNSDIYNAVDDDKEVFAIDYSGFVSTAVGVFIVLIFLSFTFDIAVRAIKLSFLQLIAPIPIISYIDPDSGKNGMFKKWLSEIGKTWANLFIRLIAVFFAVYVIQQFSSSGALYHLDNYKPKSGSLWINLFIVIGALMFAKQLPQLLETLIPGMKMGGSFNLNPLKKVANEAVGGKFLAGAAVAGAVGTAGVIAGGKAKYDALRNTGHSKFGAAFRGGLMGGIGGGLRSAGRTVINGSDGSIGGTMKTMKNGFASAGHGTQNIYAKDGTSFRGRNMAKIQKSLGLDTNADKYKKVEDSYKSFTEKFDLIKDEVKKGVEKDVTFGLTKAHQYKLSDGTTVQLHSGLNVASEKQRLNDIISDKKYDTSVKIDAQARLKALEDAAVEDYYDANQSSNSTIAGLRNDMIDEYNKLSREVNQKEIPDMFMAANSLSEGYSYDVVNNYVKDTKTTLSGIPRNKDVKQARANDAYASRNKKS